VLDHRALHPGASAGFVFRQTQLGLHFDFPSFPSALVAEKNLFSSLNHLEPIPAL
jgi:hypothetical protein